MCLLGFPDLSNAETKNSLSKTALNGAIDLCFAVLAITPRKKALEILLDKVRNKKQDSQIKDTTFPVFTDSSQAKAIRKLLTASSA